MKITWLGHSGFRIEIEQAVLLIDPWLTGNPMFPEDKRAEAIQGVTHVFLSHAHGDHLADAPAIAKEKGVPIYGIYDLMTWLGEKEGVEVVGFNKGGTVEVGSAKVTMVNACHSSSIAGVPGVGSEAGFMIAGEGHTIYFSGDTDIMADMAWMGEYHQPDIGILSAGGHFTMDMERAAWAARKYFSFRWVIPCHYRTFPLLAQNAEVMRGNLSADIDVIEPEVLDDITW